MNMKENELKKDDWIDITILSLLTIAVFAVVLKTPFSLLDDPAMLRDNPRYLKPTVTGFIQHFTDPKFHIFAPLTYCTWHVIAVFSVIRDESGEGVNMAVMGFKIASLAAHVLATIAAWWVLKQFVKNRWAILVGSLIFAVHPMTVESVAWTTGLKDELCGLFSFLAIATYARHLHQGRRRLWYWTMAWVVCAALSKPTAVVLPVILLAIDFYSRKVKFDVRLGSVSWFFVPAISSAMVMIYIQTALAVESPLWARPLIALDAIAFYIYKVLLPIQVQPDYGRSPMNIIQSGQIYWTWIFSLGVLAAMIAWGSKRVRLASALFVLPLLPILGLTRFDMQQYTTVADHYIYQSLLAAGLVAAILIERYSKLIPVAGLIIAGLSVLTIQQLTLWQTPGEHYRLSLSYHPKSIMLLRGLTNFHLNRNENDIAEEYARRAIEAEPRFGDYSNLAYALIRQKRFEEAKLVARDAVKIGTDRVYSLRILFNRTIVLQDTELDEMILQLWSRIDPKNSDVQLYLNRIRKVNAASKPSTQPL